ncbi:MAG: hypothetical protein JWN66_4954 [Sphingomonas bacterium]|nr:hypothetical protein [Sphingomonas bacterium]MDB5707838.1 hypothetical protein [Sphingomonas bacterium]
MTTVFIHGQIACYLADGEYYVYAGVKLIRVCPSIGMAREVAASL